MRGLSAAHAHHHHCRQLAELDAENCPMEDGGLHGAQVLVAGCRDDTHPRDCHAWQPAATYRDVLDSAAHRLDLPSAGGAEDGRHAEDTRDASKAPARRYRTARRLPGRSRNLRLVAWE